MNDLSSTYGEKKIQSKIICKVAVANFNFCKSEYFPKYNVSVPIWEYLWKGYKKTTTLQQVSGKLMLLINNNHDLSLLETFFDPEPWETEGNKEIVNIMIRVMKNKIKTYIICKRK